MCLASMQVSTPHAHLNSTRGNKTSWILLEYMKPFLLNILYLKNPLYIYIYICYKNVLMDNDADFFWSTVGLKSWKLCLFQISKWICPSAPTRQVTLFGGYPCTAWFNVESMSEDACDDLEGLDASATHVANLLSNEPDDVKLGIAGFSIGAAVALYSATCRAVGQYGNGNRYPINLSATVALSGWLPTSRNLRNRVGASQEAARRTASLPTLLCHGQALESMTLLTAKSGRNLHKPCIRLDFKT
ncbi:acyl-protein thioesterase 1-like isoform X2 [Cynara cardunculus var. scolymus]|uniref:acyl-protein thioesterase 1-like isoform X2 n=1 Tax=Cynara cardunculus var. scolymus TaxID=59895 RepID=UPI000D62AF3D|nr:acyl-protein thioesterase 1-like isoform X2 [Cynara cardunculus var. scolymus]